MHANPIVMTPKPDLDRSAWKFALISSNIVGATAGLFSEHFIRNMLDVTAQKFWLLAVTVTYLLTMFVLPGILSGMVHRYRILLAYIPITFQFAWFEAVKIFDTSMHIPWSHPTLHSSSKLALIARIATVVSPFLTSLIVTWMRVQITRSHAKQAEQSDRAAQDRIERKGVWPPPVTPIENPESDGAAINRFQ